MSTLEERLRNELKVSEDEQRANREQIAQLNTRNAFLAEHSKRLVAILGEPSPNPREGVLIAGAAPLQGMTMMSAAAKILKEAGGRASLSDIVKTAIEGGFRQVHSDSEVAKFRNSLASVLYNAAKEENAEIVRDETSPGFFRLATAS